MAKQLGVAGDVAYTCETAAHFWLLHVLARWEKFVAAAETSRSEDCVQVCVSFAEQGWLYKSQSDAGWTAGGCCGRQWHLRVLCCKSTLAQGCR